MPVEIKKRNSIFPPFFSNSMAGYWKSTALVRSQFFLSDSNYVLPASNLLFFFFSFLEETRSQRCAHFKDANLANDPSSKDLVSRVATVSLFSLLGNKRPAKVVELNERKYQLNVTMPMVAATETDHSRPTPAACCIVF